jgi:tetratricopeptide (TPR) repeat protein
LAGRLQLDVFRLQMASAGLTDAVDYTEMAALALQEGSAIEAARLLDQGYAEGLLVAGDKGSELQKLTDKARKSAAEDRATLEKDVLRAKTLPDGLAMFNYGFNLFQAGQTERGVAQMEQALAKGIARNSDLARLKLVAVYAELKQRDKALPLLQALSGKTDPVGLEECVRYWTLLLR